MKNEEISSVINEIPDSELKDFLVNIIKYDERIYDLFRRNFVKYFPKVSIDEYKRKIECSIIESGGRDGYIDYLEGNEYTNRIYGFTREASNLIDISDYVTAFNIVKIILDFIPDTPIDGSNGELEDVEWACMDIMEKILNVAPKDDNVIRNIFDYIVNEIKIHTLSNFSLEIDKLILKFIKKDLYLDECEKVLLDAIEDCDIEHKWYSYKSKDYLNYLNELYKKVKK